MTRSQNKTFNRIENGDSMINGFNPKTVTIKIKTSKIKALWQLLNKQKK